MKFNFLLLFIFISINLKGQIIKPIFYNNSWELTQKKYSEYFRICRFDTINEIFYGDIKDYYSCGTLQMEGQLSHLCLPTGKFNFYYKNGQLKCTGEYLNEEKNGIWKYYYTNGKLKDIIEFSNNNYKVLEYYDSLGNIQVQNGNGIWENSYYFPLTMDFFTIKGKLINGRKEGKWVCFVQNDSLGYRKRIQYKERFKEGNFIKGAWYWGGGAVESMNTEYLNKVAHEDWKFSQTFNFKRVDFVSINDYPFFKFLPQVDSLRLPVEKHAEYNGGENELDKFLRKNLRYPHYAIKNHLETIELVQFIVENDGSITNIESTPNIYDEEIAKAGFHTELIRVVELMPNWIPATRDSINVAERVFLNIEFEFIENKPKTQYNTLYK